MALTASWTHGNVAVLENPGNLPVKTIPRGWGVEFYFPRSENENIALWIHVPVPTPVLINDVRGSVLRYFLLFACDPNLGHIDTVQLYDGQGPHSELQ